MTMITDLRDLFPESKKLDEKSVNALLKALKQNHENGQFDYLKFKQSIHSLIELNMTEDIAVKSAFTTASTLGLTKESLLNSAEKYIYALESERETFAQAVLGQQKMQIDDRKSEVEELAKKIKEHQYKISELEREITIFQSRIDNVDQDVENAQIKIDKTKNKFLDAYNVIQQSIVSDIESIKKYL